MVAAYDQLLAQGLVESRASAASSCARRWAMASGPRAVAAAPRSAGADQRHHAGSAACSSRPAPSPCRAWARCRSNGWIRPCSPARCAKVSAQLAAARCMASEPAGDSACGGRWRHGWWSTASPPAPADHHHRRHSTRWTSSPAPARPARSVLVDEPGWSVEYARLAALACACCRCRAAPEGPDLASDAAPRRGAAGSARPRLYVTVSVLHNLTGASLSLQSAQRCSSSPRRTTSPSSRTTPTPTWRRRTCRAWRAGRAGAHRLRLGLLQDPHAELAHRLYRRAGALGRPPDRHQAARHADHALDDGVGAGSLPGAWPADGTCRTRAAPAGRARRPLGGAGARPRLPLRRRAARPVRLGRHRRRHRAPRPGHARRRLADRAGRPVPRLAAPTDADAHQLRHHAGGALLARPAACSGCLRPFRDQA